jgi:hypothetical protein
MTQAMLADEPKLFRQRWVNHMVRVVAEMDLDPAEIQDIYALVWERATGKLAAHSRELLEPYFDELAEALAPAMAGR